MLDSTVFLSQLMGPTLMVLGVALAVNKKYYSSWFKRMDKESEAFLWVVSVIEFVTGLAIIIAHNAWGSLAEIIISIFGWSMVLEGAVMLLGGKAYIKFMLGFFSKKIGEATVFAALLCVLMGIYLSWIGFMI